MTVGRSIRPLLVVLAVIVLALVVSTVVRDEPSRQEQIATRGAEVMPFDLDATTHVFEPTPTGVVQTVVADDPSDAEQVDLIRGHLREEQRRFGAGDFGDPVTIHGDEMPGVAVLQEQYEALDTEYRDRPDGAAITYRSDNPEVVAALHEWFAAQLEDHGSHVGE